MKYKFLKIKDYIINITSKFLSCYKVYLLVFFILFLIAFITGVMTCSNYASSIDCDKFINNYLYAFLCRESSYISFFLILSFYFLVLAILFFFVSCNAFFVVVDTIILILSSYILGFDICVMILSLGLSGIIFGVIVFGVLGILVMIVLMALLSITCKRLKERKNSCETLDKKSYIQMFFVLVLLGVTFLFLFSLLLSIIHIFVIVE